MKFAHLDDNESIFFSRELEHVKATTYDVRYPMLKQRQLIPVSFAGHPADEFVTYYQYDQVGMAKIIRDYANDFPSIELLGKKFSSEIQGLGAAYQYSIQEIRAAAKTGKPLETAKANAARRAIMQKERDLAFYGSAEFNVPGWFSNANIPDVALTSGDWLAGARTADQILVDLNKLANAPINNSKTTESPNTLILPVKYYTLISSTPRSSTSDTTILEYFLKNNPFINSVDWLAELDSANSGGNLARSLGIVYDRNIEKFWLEIPQEFESFEPEKKGLAYKVPCHERCGGTIVPYPLSQAKTDDLDAA